MADFLSRANYKIMNVIGGGAFGKVFKILDTNSNKIYALKKIDLNNDETEENINSIENEAKILKSIHHENIVQYYDCFKEKDSFYIIMEYCENKDLRNFINYYKVNKKLIHERVILEIWKALKNAIKEIHSKNIIHRDLKPENIFISENYKIKIGYFGIAKILDGTNYAQTFAGTLSYLAPEIINGKKYKNKVDIWSLGCILYELCTLNKCFASNNIINLIGQINSGVHGKIDLNYYTARLQNLIDLMIKKEDKERPNIEEVIKLDSSYTLDEYKKIAINTIDELGRKIIDKNCNHWGGYDLWIANTLFNKSSNNHIYNNILIKASIIFLHGETCSKTYNFSYMKVKEIDKVKLMFQQKSISGDSISINDKLYDITNYTEGLSIEFKSGNEGGTIAKTNFLFIIGIYDQNKFYKIDGKEEKQNSELCKFVVEDAAKIFKELNY